MWPGHHTSGEEKVSLASERAARGELGREGMKFRLDLLYESKSPTDC